MLMIPACTPVGRAIADESQLVKAGAVRAVLLSRIFCHLHISHSDEVLE